MGSWFEGTVPPGRREWRQELGVVTVDSISCLGSRDGWILVFIFIQTRAPTHRVVSPLFMMGIPASANMI